MMEKLALGQYVPYNSDTYRHGFEFFNQNLEDLESICVSRKVMLILSTQVSNLRDQPPFVSGDPPKARPGTQQTFDEIFTRGVGLLQEGRADSALVLFLTAEGYDTLRAETHYQIARCLESLGRLRSAREHYIKARDYDQLRFRASSDFNTAILEVSDNTNVFSIDMEHVFRDHSPDSLIGNELMFEHLHPKARGYFLMAKEYAHVMRDHQLLASSEEWKKRDTVSDDLLWQQRCLTDLDERIALRRTEILTSGWPFQSQFPIVNPVAEGDTLGTIVENVTRARWNWIQAHDAAADYYLSRGEINKVEKEYEVIINQVPYCDVRTYLKLARLYLHSEKLEQARDILLESLKIERTLLAYRALADLAMHIGTSTEAVSFYEQIFTFEQPPSEQVENGYLLARAYAHAGQLQKAQSTLLHVLNINPDYRPAVEFLARLSISK